MILSHSTASRGTTRQTGVFVCSKSLTLRRLSWPFVQVVVFLPPDIPEESSGASADSPPPRRWLLFDSHPRAQLGLVGASVRSFAAKTALVAALTHAFPAIDLGTDDVVASMYNMVDCTPMSLKQAANG